MNDKKYLNLYNSVKNDIINGTYSPGQKLPSKRVMADKTGYSLITIEKSYEMLSDEGYISPVQRSGYFVNKLDSFSVGEKNESGMSFSYLTDDVSENTTSDFEYSVWFKTIRKVISEQGEKLFIKSPNKGCAILRNAIADYLKRYRKMTAPPERIIIGSGSEQLYENAVQILGRDKIYGIENPSYSQIEAVYLHAGAGIQKLQMGKNGIKSTELKKEFDVLHVTPFHSYPTGVTTSITKRLEYLKWAKNGRYIIEDDFDSEFFIPGQPIESLYSLDSMQSVIYINTFSKSLSPSMRMGYMIIPEQLIPEYDKILGKFSCSVPVLDQYILAEFISSGSFERHLNRIRRKIKTQRK